MRTLLLVGALLVQGCARWEPQLVPVAVVLEAEQPRLIKVAAGDRTIAFHEPRIEGDRLIGVTRSGASAMPVAEVSRVWVRRSNPALTLVAIPGFVMAGLVGLMAATWNH